jgi:hypothetical protein
MTALPLSICAQVQAPYGVSLKLEPLRDHGSVIGRPKKIRV